MAPYAKITGESLSGKSWIAVVKKHKLMFGGETCYLAKSETFDIEVGDIVEIPSGYMLKPIIERESERVITNGEGEILFGLHYNNSEDASAPGDLDPRNPKFIIHVDERLEHYFVISFVFEVPTHKAMHEYFWHIRNVELSQCQKWQVGKLYLIPSGFESEIIDNRQFIFYPPSES